MNGAKALNGSLGPGTQDPNEGTQMLGPKYWDPNSEVWNVWVPSAGTHHPGTQMKGPRYRDPSKGQRHIMGPERLEALYESLGWRHLKGPQRSEALYRSLGWRYLFLLLWLQQFC